MFDPTKHRKTSARLAELKTKAPQNWEIRKPKEGDFIQIWGDTIEDLAIAVDEIEDDDDEDQDDDSESDEDEDEDSDE